MPCRRAGDALSLLTLHCLLSLCFGFLSLPAQKFPSTASSPRRGLGSGWSPLRGTPAGIRSGQRSHHFGSAILTKNRPALALKQPRIVEEEEDEGWMDPSCAEMRVMNARLSGEVHLPKWGRKFQLRSEVAGEGPEELELREFRGGMLSSKALGECFNMTKLNMEAMYVKSSWGWSDAKKMKSLSHESARFVVATSRKNGEVVGFVHYRFEIEDNVLTLDTEGALYVHELQVLERAQGKGLGGLLMRIMEHFAEVQRMDKCMLTVFVYNPAYKNFYRDALGYQIDTGSGNNRGTLNETVELSKPATKTWSVLLMVKARCEASSTSTCSVVQESKWAEMALRKKPGHQTTLRATSGGGGNNDVEAEGRWLSPAPVGGGESSGSVLGAALIFAGTAVGAGMLALPAETAPAGFIPSALPVQSMATQLTPIATEASLVACWLFTYVTAMLTLEASWLLGGRGDKPEGFFSMAGDSLGKPGQAFVGSLFWFLLTALIVAYTAEGGNLLVQALRGIVSVPSVVGSSIFLGAFAWLAVAGVKSVDDINRLLVGGLVATFLGLVGIGLPMVDSDLLSRSNWGAVWPQCISIGIISFGAQNIVPTLLGYLGGDSIRTKRAILIGTLVPLAMYSIWDAVFLGIVPFTADIDKANVVQALGGVAGSSTVSVLIAAFSVCAIGSSMAGACVSFVDFFLDASSQLPDGLRPFKDASPTTQRVFAAACALLPPLFFATQFEGVFLSALENAGVLGGVSLYGLVPALMVWQAKKQLGEKNESVEMPGRFGDSPLFLGVVAASSVALIIPELFRVLGDAFGAS